MTISPRMRGIGGAVAVVVLLVGAAAVTLLAVDLLRWDRQLDRADAAYAAGGGAVQDWTPGTTLPARLSRSLIGVGDDLRYRSAISRFWASEPRSPILEFEDVTRRSAAEREVARVADLDHQPERHAQLLVLRGALLLEEARNSPVQREVFARRAIEQFKRAATVDPQNADAVYDLEIALKLLRSAGAAQGAGGDARSPNPDSGSGATTSGGGL